MNLYLFLKELDCLDTQETVPLCKRTVFFSLSFFFFTNSLRGSDLIRRGSRTWRTVRLFSPQYTISQPKHTEYQIFFAISIQELSINNPHDSWLLGIHRYPEALNDPDRPLFRELMKSRPSFVVGPRVLGKL